MLDRRELGHRARRRVQASPGVTTSEQSIEAAGFPADVESYQAQHSRKQEAECEKTYKPLRCESILRLKTANAELRGSMLSKDRSYWPGVT